MKRAIAIISILVTLTATVAYTTLAVNAHPGRTDGNGGHTNHSTGEYHYHHGYSAHDHYDMDGDGVVDCPYEFDDRTNHWSNGTTSSKEDHTDLKDTQPATEPNTNQHKKRSIVSYLDVETVALIVISVLVVVFWLAPVIFWKK